MHVRSLLAAGVALFAMPGLNAGPGPAAATAESALQRASTTPTTGALDLTALLTAGRLRGADRAATALAGRPGAVHVDGRPGPGVVWIEGTDFRDGTIALEIRGRDAFQQSFPGVAFHRRDDRTYEAVYLRPFNFRAADPARHQHALQYVAVPDFDWPRLREQFPEEFENPVSPSVSPTDWVPVRIVVRAGPVQIHVGSDTSPTLDVRKLGTFDRGEIGLWVGNNSDGDFANLRVTPAP